MTNVFARWDLAVWAVLIALGLSYASAQDGLTPNGFSLPSPLTGDEIIDCQAFASPYLTTCTTAQIAGLAGATTTLINNSGGTVNPGEAIYINGAGRFGLAIASAYSTAGAIAFTNARINAGASGNITTGGTLQLATAQWDAFTGQSGGLTSGLLYFLSPTTAGHITTVPPSTPGQLVVVVGRAMSPTVILSANNETIKLNFVGGSVGWKSKVT
jgi:hypothetical protein